MDDELYHYGRKGMKWGQNIFGDNDRSTKSRKRNESVSNGLTSPRKDNFDKYYRERHTKSVAKVLASVERGRESVNRFLQTPTGKAVKVAAVIGLSYAGMGAAVSVANLVAFRQSPLRTLGLDGFDSAYTIGTTLGEIKRFRA